MMFGCLIAVAIILCRHYMQLGSYLQKGGDSSVVLSCGHAVQMWPAGAPAVRGMQQVQQRETALQGQQLVRVLTMLLQGRPDLAQKLCRCMCMCVKVWTPAAVTLQQLLQARIALTGQLRVQLAWGWSGCKAHALAEERAQVSLEGGALEQWPEVLQGLLQVLAKEEGGILKSRSQHCLIPSLQTCMCSSHASIFALHGKVQICMLHPSSKPARGPGIPHGQKEFVMLAGFKWSRASHAGGYCMGAALWMSCASMAGWP